MQNSSTFALPSTEAQEFTVHPNKKNPSVFYGAIQYIQVLHYFTLFGQISILFSKIREYLQNFKFFYKIPIFVS